MKLLFLVLAILTISAPVQAAQVSGNAIYSWWTHPIATQSSDLYFTGVTSSGDWRAFKNDSSSYTTLEHGVDDDHNAPSLLVRPGHDNIAFWTKHGAQTYINYARSPEGTLNFGTKQTIQFPGTVTYSQVLTLDDKIILFTRGHGYKWQYTISEDDGLTWSTPDNFLDTSSIGSFYLLFTPTQTANVYNIAGSANPANTYGNIIYGQLNLNTGDVEGGNLYTGSNLPLTTDSFELINPTQSSDQRVRLLDVSQVNGKPTIIYAKKGNTITSRYYKAIYDSGWTRSTLNDSAGDPINTGDDFDHGSSKYYIGGVALTGSTFYVSLESGTWKIKKYTFNSDFTTNYIGTLASNTKPLVRPYAIRNGSGILYLQLNTYNTYKDYQSYIHRVE